MTCTSEDRIEVAAKLRQIADEHDVIHAFSNADIRYIADLIVMESDKCVNTRCMLYNDIASCIEDCGNFNACSLHKQG